MSISFAIPLVVVVLLFALIIGLIVSRNRRER
jgi:uncharacterized protein YneF (UPF0154 family)